jgi:hypothetical protein
LEIVKIKTAQGVFLLEDAGCATAAALITSCRQRPRHLLDQTSQGQQRRYHITAVIKPGQWSPRLVHARSSTDSIVKQPNPTLRHPNSVRSRVPVVWCCGSAASQRKPRGRAAQSAPDALTAEPPALGARGIVRRRHPPEIRVISKR